ncbi:hypothetical protein OHA45_06500 [Streptomyces lydicus]|uniref:hypothetical protein n=1 Tax=Streptomyces lydicus TaxID=47763 RepID=UPI002E35F69B|nr:hypothetical protein [Streptomyces lydicus]
MRTARTGTYPKDGGSVADEAEASGRTGDGIPRAASRRRMLTAAAAAGLGLLTGCGEASSRSPGADPTRAAAPSPGGSGRSPSAGSGTPGPSASRAPGRSGSPAPPRRRPELPRGGRELFPRYRLVGFCGLPGAAALGRLGTGDPGERAAEIEKVARSYAAGREPLPVLELLAVVANSSPGPDGRYRSRTPAATVRRFHQLAQKHRALLLLNIQPGRASVLDEVKALRDWLVHPDVGIALDPEWEMAGGQVPGDTYGRTDGHELTRVARYLSGLVKEHDLPEKPLVFHQVATSVVREQSALEPQPGVALIKSADGIGSPGLKRGTWRRLVRGLPDGVHTGFKLFYEEDAKGSRLMTPKEVLRLRPRPEYVMYE